MDETALDANDRQGHCQLRPTRTNTWQPNSGQCVKEPLAIISSRGTPERYGHSRTLLTL